VGTYTFTHQDGRESTATGAMARVEAISIAEYLNASGVIDNPIVRIDYDDDQQTSAHGLVWTIASAS
jgi:hypothetical protein